MTDAIQGLREEVRAATDALAQDYCERLEIDPGFDPDGFFDELRRMVEARAATLMLVELDGPMGGGGADEA